MRTISLYVHVSTILVANFILLFTGQNVSKNCLQELTLTYHAINKDIAQQLKDNT